MQDVIAEPAALAPPNPLLHAPVLPTLIQLTLPNLAAMFVTAAVAVAETSYVGRLGTVPLAAMALVFPLAMSMQMLSAGAMGGGVSSAISRALGAGDTPRAESLAWHSVALGLGLGAIFALLLTVFATPILAAIGGRGEVLAEATAYAQIALAGAIIIWLVNTLASVLRGTGNMRVPSIALLAASGLQIVLGGALGLGLGPVPRLGLTGVALGGVLASLTSLTFLLWYLLAGRARVRLQPAPIEWEKLRDILKVGAVASVGPLQVVVTMLIVARLVAGFGTETIAGFGIGTRLEFLLVPIVFAVGVASVPMVGMAIGANDVARARRVAWTAAALATIVLGVIGCFVTLAPGLWSSLFTSDPTVRAAADLYMRCTGFGYAFVGLGLSLFFASQGSGKMIGPVLAGMSRVAVVAIGAIVVALTSPPLWCVFALVGLGMIAFGTSVAYAVYSTRWGAPDPIRLAA